ncbi:MULTISPECIES: flagellar hook assembly protein FlgD [Gulbenkiania]|uniref:Basal-body rod modification protein FlgD n=2 Tax=Gulbenkiania TaxID=397456 RepID=A0A0K6H586_9NEIS|nr:MULTISPECIES: flagellar hook capping FlgD N-terminal domain-containing protein [Gulbenkiania]TCW29893.1 flagellar basal-body rod modification protein FlgD [Gulbenkiania mobilis]CUA86135.1 Flagellar hook assembly protein FlgD [Gulbenkiania indica]
MATIDSTTLNRINGTSGSGTSGTTTGNSSEAIQNRFLKLLTTQLQAQDPLNPMDNSQMTAQMAQISTVSGLEKLNSAMEMLTQSQQAAMSLASASLIGRQVLTEGSGLKLENGQAKGAVYLGSSADQVKISVFNAEGAEVDNFVINNAASGTTYFNWDGTSLDNKQLADGKYTFRVEASSNGSKLTDVAAMNYQKVNGLSFNGGATYLNLADGSRLALGQVAEVA